LRQLLAFGGLLLALMLQSCGGGDGIASGGETGTNVAASATNGGSTSSTKPPTGPPSIRFVTTGGTPFQGVYLAAQQAIFVTNPALSEVDEISTGDWTVRARIPVVKPIGLDASPDGSRLYVGSEVQTIATIDPVKEQVIATASPPWFQAPRIPLVLNNGEILLISSTPGSQEDFIGEGSNAMMWNPSTGTFQDRSLGTPFARGPIARSADGSKVIVGTYGVPSQIAVYDVSTDTFVYSNALANPIVSVAANSNGTQFAATDGHGLIFFDQNLSQIGSANVPVDFHGMGYTPDNHYLYGPWAGNGNPRLFVVDTSSFQVAGYIPGPFSSAAPIPFALDQSGSLLVVDNGGGQGGGVALLPFQPLPTLGNGPGYPSYPRWSPGQAPVGQSISTQLLSNGFETGMEVFFGSVGAAITSLVPGPGGEVTVQTPSSGSGVESVLFQFPDGWSTLLPDSFSYGPTALQLTASGGPPGAPITLFGYGFDFPVSQVQVTMGGQPAPIYSAGPIELSTIFPFDQITFFAPPHPSGPVDITLNTPLGTATIHNGFRYPQNTVIFQTPSNLSQIIFDPKRKLLYATSGNLIQVFSPASMQFLAPIHPPGAAANSQYKGLALTPDSSLLVVADGPNQAVSIFNPDNPVQGTSVLLGGISAQTCAPPAAFMPYVHPYEVVTTSTGKAFVSETNSGPVEIDLKTGQFQYRCDAAAGRQNAFAANADGSKVVAADIIDSSAVVAIWNASTDTFTAQSVQWYTYLGDVAISADGTRIVATDGDQVDALNDSYLLDSSLHLLAETSYPELSPAQGRWVPGIKLNSTGSLYILPRQQGIDILDAQTGLVREQIITPEPLLTSQNVASIVNGLAVDESTNTLFAVSVSGLTVVQLVSLPVGIGSVMPNQGSASGGAAVMLNGSGFEQGAEVWFGSEAAQTTFVDSRTLKVLTPPTPSGPARITVRNPDGSSYFLDAAYVAN
jgi:hypothetical protein